MPKAVYLYCDVNDLITVISDLSVKTVFKYCILESLAEIVFEEFNFNNSAREFLLKEGKRSKVSEWNSGRIFGEQVELRWCPAERFTGKPYHLLIISDDDSLMASFKYEVALDLSAYDITKGEVYLWGESTIEGPEPWYEEQVPKFLSYPVSVSPNKSYRVKLEYKNYEKLEFGSDGCLKTNRLIRFINLHAEEVK